MSDLVRLDEELWARGVVAAWMIDGLADLLGMEWHTVALAMDHLPTNSILMLDTAEGCSVIASAVSSVLGQPTATFAVRKH